MITCPSCGQTIPDSTDVCQFCHAQLGPPAARPIERKTGHGMPANVVWGLYYAVSGYWVLSGVGNVIYALVTVGDSGGAYFGYTVNTITALCGVGLLFRVEFIRAIVSFISCLKLLFGVFGLIGNIMSIAIVGPIGILFTFFGLIDIISAGMMIWLIGETRTKALG